jgi:hypothetical protein
VGARAGCLHRKAIQKLTEVSTARRSGDLRRVMCGSGRTGVWRASEEDGITADVHHGREIAVGGYLPLGAAVYTQEVADAMAGIGP